MRTFSPDGSIVSYVGWSDALSSYVVMVANSDGSGTPLQVSDYNPWSGAFWSPDGTKLAFESDHDDPNNDADLFVLTVR